MFCRNSATVGTIRVTNPTCNYSSGSCYCPLCLRLDCHHSPWSTRTLHNPVIYPATLPSSEPPSASIGHTISETCISPFQLLCRHLERRIVLDLLSAEDLPCFPFILRLYAWFSDSPNGPQSRTLQPVRGEGYEPVPCEQSQCRDAFLLVYDRFLVTSVTFRSGQLSIYRSILSTFLPRTSSCNRIPHRFGVLLYGDISAMRNRHHNRLLPSCVNTTERLLLRSW